MTETVETVEEKQPEKHDTREEIAKELGWSQGKVSRAEYVKKNNPDKWQESEVSVLTETVKTDRTEKMFTEPEEKHDTSHTSIYYNNIKLIQNKIE